MLPAFDPIEDAVRAWAQAAGIRVDQIVLNRRGHPVLIVPVRQAQEALERPTLPLEILTVLREADKPLTGMLVLDALAAKGIHASKRTVDGHLAEMTADGTLANPTSDKVRGYRLPG